MTTRKHSDDDSVATPRAILNRARICTVDAALIEKLKREALRVPLGRYRLCMHHSTSDPMQDMIVVHRRGNYARPHSHPAAASSYTMIEGLMDVLIFDDIGTVTERIRMGRHDDPEADAVSLHLSPGTVYTAVCLTETAVFQETIGSPNPCNAATRYAAWSPTEEEPERMVEFRRRLGIDV